LAIKASLKVREPVRLAHLKPAILGEILLIKNQIVIRKDRKSFRTVVKIYLFKR